MKRTFVPCSSLSASVWAPSTVTHPTERITQTHTHIDSPPSHSFSMRFEFGCGMCRKRTAWRCRMSTEKTLQIFVGCVHNDTTHFSIEWREYFQNENKNSLFDCLRRWQVADIIEFIVKPVTKIRTDVSYFFRMRNRRRRPQPMLTCTNLT